MDANRCEAHAIPRELTWLVFIWLSASNREEKPENFYRIVARVAAGISDRLKMAAERITGSDPQHLIGGVRTEHDSLGERELPNDAYYGVQTLRAMENFSISGVTVKNFAHFIEAFAFVKKAAAQANCELGVLDEEKMTAICDACDELLAGKLHDQFTVDMFQGGAGTLTNMMANEVIANRGLELMGNEKGEYEHLHPNDHVNRSQLGLLPDYRLRCGGVHGRRVQRTRTVHGRAHHRIRPAARHADSQKRLYHSYQPLYRGNHGQP